MKLFTYSLSSAAYRVRIALNLKSIDHELVPVHLRHGDHKSPEYLALNPQGLVPALGLDDGTILAQSMAILEFLDETHPEPPLLPADAIARAQVRAAADIVACDIHPLNNLRVLLYLRGPLSQDEAEVTAWYHTWLKSGFDAFEQLIDPAPFCFGDAPGLADVCLIPQLFNARRFEFALDDYPKIREVEEACATLDAFEAAHPSNHTDE
jgi:maleylacetoacetate isomerase